MRAVHPEAHDGEVWIGNMRRGDFRAVGWTNKRFGKTAYFTDGTPFPKSQGFGPVFVERAEIEAAGVAIPESGVIDHRW